MLSLHHDGPTFCDGLTRREWLRAGGLALGGLSLSHLLRHQSHAARTGTRAGKAKSVIIFGLVGGPPQHETWDPKPTAPAEVRGPLGTIQSRTVGLRVGELMPLTAALSDKVAVLRAVVTNDNAHSTSGYQMLTGVPHQPLNQENATPKAPNTAPSVGSMVRYLMPRPGQLPSAVTIPDHIWNDGNLPWPGQAAGVLGRKHDPWLVHCHPESADFKMEGLRLPPEVTAGRMAGRKGLLARLDRHLDAANRAAEAELHDAHARKALELVSSRAARSAFGLSREPRKLRERYGPSRFAQSCLLARRLVEAGVSLVQVNWTRHPGQLNQGGWDTHNRHVGSLKQFLMPTMDRAFSALITDLEVRGLLDETLVVWFGEFGRTPRFNGAGGRDHWGHCFSLALAGGGVRGGAVYGASDRSGAYPADGKVEAKDLIATVLHCLGLPPDAELRDAEGRPFAATRGKPIRQIL